MTESLKDKIAVIGMGCVKFGDKWEEDAADMEVDATYEAYADAGLGLNDIQAAWKGSVVEGLGEPMAYNLKTDYIPITRVENACVTGADAFRLACFGIASGTYDITMALGFEKTRDSGMGAMRWLPGGGGGPNSGLAMPNGGAVTAFARLAARYMEHYHLSYEEFKPVLAKIAAKNRRNGSLNPKASNMNAITEEDALNARMVAWPLGIHDCSVQSDGCAVAILCRADMAKKYRDDFILVKGIGEAVGARQGTLQPNELVQLEETVQAAKQAYAMAGIKDPAKEIDFAEVHDSTSMTELITMEDLGFAPRGKAPEYVKAGKFNLDGDLPVNPDGGTLSFGHPIGATGLRTIYEVYKQLQGKSGPRQVKNAKLGLAQTFGLIPGSGIANVTILGKRN
jgi:acetyl-CoA C-acetyltransferase